MSWFHRQESLVTEAKSQRLLVDLALEDLNVEAFDRKFRESGQLLL
jgi:hypothetical protein